MAPLSADLHGRLEFALAAARSAERVILQYYRSDVTVERKRDNSPVTIADRSAEEILREAVAQHYGDDGVLGEEFGERPGCSGYRWIFDPIDGTKSFIHGVPLFGTLIGLEHDGRCVLGVCHFPALDETVWGVQGAGAWWRVGNAPPRPARVSGVSRIEDGLFSFTTIQGFGRIGRADVFEHFLTRAHLVRGWGDCYGHALVATGRAEVMIDPQMNPWDAAALLPILQEAGGRFVDWDGTATIHGGNGISVNAALADEVLAVTRRLQ